MFGLVESIVTPGGVEIRDMRTLSEEESSRLQSDFHHRMDLSLKAEPSWDGETVRCDEPDALAPLNNAYVDHVQAERAAGREPQTYEEFSAIHASTLIPDLISYPHLGIQWFALKAPGETEYDGALVVTNIWRIREDEPGKDYFIGWPTVVAPNSMDFKATWGDVCRYVMDTDLVVSDGGLLIDFVEWALPTGVESRYVDRGDGNTFGVDLLRIMGDGLRVHFEGEDLGKAPSVIKRELRPEDADADYPVYTAGSEPAASSGG